MSDEEEVRRGTLIAGRGVGCCRSYSHFLALPPQSDVSLADLARFPPCEVCSDAVCFNRQYQSHLRDRWHYEPHLRTEIEVALGEAQRMERCWELLRDAHNNYRDDTRLEWLRGLRTIIGPVAYLRGDMPPPVPLHRFVVTD